MKLTRCRLPFPPSPPLPLLLLLTVALCCCCLFQPSSLQVVAAAEAAAGEAPPLAPAEKAQTTTTAAASSSPSPPPPTEATTAKAEAEEGVATPGADCARATSGPKELKAALDSASAALESASTRVRAILKTVAEVTTELETGNAGFEGMIADEEIISLGARLAFWHIRGLTDRLRKEFVEGPRLLGLVADTRNASDQVVAIGRRGLLEKDDGLLLKEALTVIDTTLANLSRLQSGAMLDLEAVGVQLLERVAAVKEGLSKKAFLQQAAWETADQFVDAGLRLPVRLVAAATSDPTKGDSDDARWAARQLAEAAATVHGLLADLTAAAEGCGRPK